MENQTSENQEMSEEEEKALKEWGDISNASEVKDLDQSEIDNLLGFEAKDNKSARGVKAMLDRALVSYERLPMLEIVFERFIRILSASLRNLTEDNVDLTMKSINSLRYGSYIDSSPIPALVNIFRAKEWDNYGLFVADSSLIFSLVDLLFGGKKSNRPVKIEGRPFTLIEQSLVKQLTEIILRDLADSFRTLGEITFRFERMETDPRFATIARASDSCVLAKIFVEIEDRKGGMEVLFPYAAIEPIKSLLTQVFIGEQFGSDAEWQKCVIEKILNTEIKVEALIRGKPSAIEKIANLEVGSTIVMDQSPEDDIIVVCDNVEISTAKIGKLGKKMAIALNDPVQNKNLNEK